MADAKDRIVVHGGSIVVMDGKIVMGPCDPMEYYARLMIGSETMEEWFWRLHDSELVEWGKWVSAGFANPVFYYREDGVSGAALPQIKGTSYDYDDQRMSLHWQIGDSYSDKAFGIVKFGSAPEVGLYWNGAYQFYYNQEFKEYYPRFSSRSSGAKVPEGYLDEGTFVVDINVFGEYRCHYEYHETYPNAPSRDKHSSEERTRSRKDRALYKFVVSKTENGEGMGGSNINVEIVGYGDWSRELRETAVGNITDMSFVPTVEIVRVKKDKDGNPVEEVVWQSE